MDKNNREKLILTKEKAREIIWGDSKDFTIISDEITSKGRWSIYHWVIVKRKSDGKYFADQYSLGATESQDEGAYDNNDPDFKEVFPVQKTITVYE